jgi:biopolymer transport protein ExbD
MRFRAQRHQQNQMPEVNLVPMMDVIMTILTFFIIISMSLNDFQSIEIRLPSKGSGTSKNSDPKNQGGTESLVIAINPKRQLFINQKPTTRDQLIQQTQIYLQANPQGKVIIVADKTVPYEEVLQTLTTLRDLGGDRVSLSFQ